MNIREKLFGIKHTKMEAIQLVCSNGRLLQTLSKDLKNDYDVVLSAVKQYCHALEYASRELKNNKNIVLEAINQDGNTLQHASIKLKNDKETVLAALNNDGDAFQYISKKLKNDKEVVLVAVKNFKHCDAFNNYLSLEFKNDKEVLLEYIYNRMCTYSATSPEYLTEPIFYYVFRHYDSIIGTDWPVVKRALLEKPDYFLNPEPYIKALTDGMKYPYLLLAQYALNKDTAPTMIEPYPDITF